MTKKTQASKIELEASKTKIEKCDYCRTPLPLPLRRKDQRFCPNNGKCRKAFHRYGGLSIIKIYERLRPMIRREIRDQINKQVALEMGRKPPAREERRTA